MANDLAEGRGEYSPDIGGVSEAAYCQAWSAELAALWDRIAALIAIMQQADARQAEHHRLLLGRPQSTKPRSGNLDDLIKRSSLTE